MLDNALEPYISQQKSPSSGRALLALETQGSAERPIRTGIAGEEADRAARNCPDKGRCPFAPATSEGFGRTTPEREGGRLLSESTPQARPCPRTAVRDVTNHKLRLGGWSLPSLRPRRRRL